MHRRRRQQVVLRPSMDYLLNDMKFEVEANTKVTRNEPDKKANAAKAVMRAEQLFLLATHPVARQKGLSIRPPSQPHEPWAEPGWHLNLDVPKPDKKSTIL
eukprot:CAMPEP_0116544506 /NCGR_PEP_ID=MMETSP0397-20121206/2154_1 /TAXON_ID=216820 /ORGANISM="Cyclophora tenuis, Strain ECT3854" /LENGTH=100 /DNA_ID=CAMNT_0004068723 /DNA_START=302 /DNA_END=601 /DNA_ORIENTATION=-